MTITQVKPHWYMGRARHGNVNLVFFGQSRGEVVRKECDWILANMEALNGLKSAHHRLRVIEGKRA